jgi:PAS domain S-box-containing protein
MNWFKRSIFLIALLFLAGVQPVQAKEVLIGVLAKRGEQKALERWEPTARYLQEQIPQHSFRIVPMEFDAIPGLVDNGLVDFVIINSGIYIDLSVRFGVQRMLTMVNKKTGGISVTQFGSTLVARATDSTINEFRDLKGKRVAAVHPTSLGGWLMVKDELKKRGVDESDLLEILFSGTHDAVIDATLSGRVDAGIVRSDTIERMAAEGKLQLNRLRIINRRDLPDFPFHVSTALYPEWPIARTKGTPMELANQVARSLLSMPQDHPAAVSANMSGWTSPMRYQPVREILQRVQAPPFENFGRVSLGDILKGYWQWLLLVAGALMVLSLLLQHVSKLNRKLKRYSEQLERSQEAFRGTFEQAAVGFAHIAPSGEVLLANQQMCNLTRYSQAELHHRNFIDLIDQEDNHILVNGLESLRRHDKDEVTCEARLVLQNGKQRWVSISFSPVWQDSKKIRHIVAVVLDVDHEKTLQLRLSKEGHMKELILDIAGDGILGLNPDATHSFVNPAAARMLGYRVEEMLGMDSHSLWHHSHKDGTPFPRNQCPITGVLMDGKTHRSRNETFWCKDGTALECEYISTPIIEDNQILGAVVVFHETRRTALDTGIVRGDMG